MNLDRLRETLDRRPGLVVRNRILLESVESTNNLALRLVRLFLDREALPPRTLVVAWRQNAGRGRLGRSWVSPPGLGAYLSLIVPMKRPGDVAALPLLVAVGLCRKISEISQSPCRLKWPNDLMVSGRKIGGILIECVSRGSLGSAAVIGIGVNYGASRALAEIGGIAMGEVTRQLPCLPEVISELVAAVEDELTHLGDVAYAAARYRELSEHRRGDHLQYRTESGIQSGTFSGLDERGFLVLQGAHGEVRLGAVEAIEEWTGRQS
jgi:BirA family biotin operon repressor/biotin-[acetyl-CoA-carboxylase] ligase